MARQGALRLGPADRFHRQSLITWWEQPILKQARILVIGTGALGNEILKNLALLGVGHVFVVDFDTIELSNLARSVLFRPHDIGRRKVDVACEAVRALYPEIAIRGFHGNVIDELGLGVFRWAHLVVCGLDNREARLEVNRNCWKVNRPWIDGAIEGLDGVVRMFEPPDGPCYECTMSETDWQLLASRRSCALLSRAQMETGSVPTTATMSSLIAALQCQEAVKWLHGRSKMAGCGILCNGTANDFSHVAYQRKEECYSHTIFSEILPLDAGVNDLTLGELLERARLRLGADAVLDLPREILQSLDCPACLTREERLVSLGKVSEAEAFCPACGMHRVPRLLQVIDDDCGVLDRTPAAVGIPPYDIISARNGDRELAFLFDGDAQAVLGELHDGD